MSGFVPAAQYVRMSTEHQRYSIENQKAAIAAYARENGFNVVRTYEDMGRSGLTLSARPGLQDLLRDVLARQADFSTILVLDVSRWGRFQDPDQSAHYEFLCKEAGARVRYCAEAFAEDDSLGTTVMKSIKRVMAAEYSRSLSERVLAGKLRLAKLGYSQGGPPPFGVHRVLISEDGAVIRRLTYGEHKAVTTQRVVFVPGSLAEQKTVRRIFRMFANGYSVHQLCEVLLAEGVADEYGLPFTASRVDCMLINRMYLGEFIFNRRRKRLAGPTTRNPSSQWIRVQIFRPIVSASLFRQAQDAKRPYRFRRYTDAVLLEHLRTVLARYGRITAANVSYDDGPASRTYHDRFGSLAAACRMIGYEKETRAPALWRQRHTTEEMLAILRRIYAEHGHISTALLRLDPEAPSREALTARFGGVLDAYRAAGWDITHVELQRETLKRHTARLREGSTLVSARLKALSASGQAVMEPRVLQPFLGGLRPYAADRPSAGG